MTATPYITPDDVRAMYPEFTSDRYSDAYIADLISEFEEIVENYVGWAFTERTVTDEEHQVDYGTLKLSTTNNWWPAFVPFKNRKVRAVTSVKINGTTLDSSYYTVDVTAKYLYFVPWVVSKILGPAFGRVQVTYTHGLTEPPLRLKRAAKLFVRETIRADNSGQSENMLSQPVEGTGTFYEAPSFADKRPTGFKRVDQLINSVTDSSRLPQVG